jgi:hypothetical protein
VKQFFELGVDGALAAVHHDNGVELPAGLIEHDFVVAGEGILSDAIWPQVRLHVVPIDARTADRHRNGAGPTLRICSPYQVPDMAVHTIVEIEETVPDP